jgi:hypothetical protein
MTGSPAARRWGSIRWQAVTIRRSIAPVNPRAPRAAALDARDPL